MDNSPEQLRRRAKADGRLLLVLALLISTPCIGSAIVYGLGYNVPVIIPTTAFMVLLVVSLTVAFIRAPRGQSEEARTRPPRPVEWNKCLSCGYSFEGLRHIELCPECATRLTYAQVVERNRRIK